jgi:hypothetical protein
MIIPKLYWEKSAPPPERERESFFLLCVWSMVVCSKKQRRTTHTERRQPTDSASYSTVYRGIAGVNVIMWRNRRLSSILNARRFSGKKGVTKYERIEPLEHVLLRPGMYVGSINPSITHTWIYNATTNKMEKKNMYYSPALVKVNIVVSL